MSLLSQLRQQLNVFQNKESVIQGRITDALISAPDGNDLTNLTAQLDIVQQNIDDTQTQIDDFLVTPTLPSSSDSATLEKYASSSVIGSLGDLTQSGSFNSFTGTAPFGGRIVPGVPPGAQPVTPPPVEAVFFNNKGADLRAKIRVPSSYLNSARTESLKNNLGILFPYTPSISFDIKADYASVNPLHSNYGVNFYQRSSIGSISIAGKFTVENEQDAKFFISTVHLLRALTKMKFGNEPDRGSPPPVCRLDAYGEMILKNVPVAIANFRIELNDNVDYFTSKAEIFEDQNSVPTISTINITCIPMYSRDEMQRFTVNDYLDYTGFKGKGYL
jgi:hypothetical protein